MSRAAENYHGFVHFLNERGIFSFRQRMVWSYVTENLGVLYECYSSKFKSHKDASLIVAGAILSFEKEESM